MRVSAVRWCDNSILDPPRITGPLWGESGGLDSPNKRARNAELWCFFVVGLYKALSKQSVNWDAMTPTSCHCNAIAKRFEHGGKAIIWHQCLDHIPSIFTRSSNGTLTQMATDDAIGHQRTPSTLVDKDNVTVYLLEFTNFVLNYYHHPHTLHIWLDCFLIKWTQIRYSVLPN